MEGGEGRVREKQLQERLLDEIEKHKEDLPEIVKPEEIEEKKTEEKPAERDLFEGNSRPDRPVPVTDKSPA